MIAQLAIFTFGMAAIWLANDPRPTLSRWACICGLIAQPFWFWETWHAGQWGIFAASFVYAFSWGRGFWHRWIRPVIPKGE